MSCMWIRRPSFWHGFVEILIRPTLSHAATLWYVYSLLTFQLLLPICLRLTRGRLGPLLVVGALCISWEALSCSASIERANTRLYFWQGAYAASILPHGWNWWTGSQTHARPFYCNVGRFDMLVRAELSDLVTVHSALHGLCRLPRWRTSSWLLLFGKYTFVIYLMNAIVIGLERCC